MTLEQINKLQDSGRNTITHTAYMTLETQNNLQRFKDLMGNSKLAFIIDTENGLGFRERDSDNSLIQLFNINNSQKNTYFT